MVEEIKGFNSMSVEEFNEINKKYGKEVINSLQKPFVKFMKELNKVAKKYGLEKDKPYDLAFYGFYSKTFLNMLSLMIKDMYRYETHRVMHEIDAIIYDLEKAEKQGIIDIPKTNNKKIDYTG